MLQLDGKTLQYDKAFVHNGIQYPSNWLRLTTLAEKQAIGIVEVPNVVEASYDRRFYYSANNPKDLDQLKESYTAEIKKLAGGMLAQTDWYVIRQAENSTAVPPEVLTRRAEIRTFSNEKEAAIAACADVAALAEYVTGSDYTTWES